jgi:hypothetical protein
MLGYASPFSISFIITNEIIHFTPHPPLPLKGGRVREGVMSLYLLHFYYLRLIRKAFVKGLPIPPKPESGNLKPALARTIYLTGTGARVNFKECV